MVMALERKSALLALEEALKVTPDKNSEAEGKLTESEEYDYSRKHAAFREIAKEETDRIVRYVGTIISDALASRTAKDSEEIVPFNICSIGCGDGERDRSILQNISVPVSYVGIDINTKSCTEARVALGELPSVEATIINEDFMQMDLTSLPQFDLVLMIHAHYYIKDLKTMFGRMHQLARGDANVVIISMNFTPLQNLSKLFFEKEWKFSLRHSEDLLQVLDEMGVNHKTESLPNGMLYMDRCFKEGFSSDFAKDVMDFFSHTNLKNYPKEIADLSIQYVRACCQATQDSSYVIDFSNDAIII